VTKRFHIAQLSIGNTHVPVDDERMIGFTGRLGSSTSASGG
jgi:hypothetical protein